ncbi:MAG: hypothetical protein K2G88_04505 [Oscillospiraceae bacterium]|nr:hypothetical protein [Oscillospiraceae bacterium]
MNKIKFISYEKLSKKAQRELNKQKRSDWGAVRPVTRIEKNPKAYKRHAKHKGSEKFYA